MAINYETLRKLIELACNNPNEHEANSAARKACKMIKEDSFRILELEDTPPTRPIYPNRNRGYTRSPFGADDFSDLYDTIRRSAAEAAKRQQEREETIRKNEKARQEREEREKKRKEQAKQEEPKFTQTERPQWNWGYTPSDAQKEFFRARSPFSWDSETTYTGRTGIPKEERASLERECTKCGVKVRTFRIKDEVFVCNVCQWSHWEKER